MKFTTIIIVIKSSNLNQIDEYSEQMKTKVMNLKRIDDFHSILLMNFHYMDEFSSKLGIFILVGNFHHIMHTR